MEQSELFNSSFEDLGVSISKSHSGHGAFTANRLLHTAALLDYYYTPILCFFGVMGNCLSVTVFCSNANHRSLSSSYYLSALAISDTGFLINLFVVWLDGMGIGVLATNFGCPFVMFSGQVTCFLSVWLTVAFTVERFFAVVHPLTKPRYCTVSKAKKVIFGLTTFAVIAFSYVLLIAQVKAISHDTEDLTNLEKGNSTEGDDLMGNFTIPGRGIWIGNGSSERSECLFSSPVPEHCGARSKRDNDERSGSGPDFDSMSSELDPLLQGIGDVYTLDPDSLSSKRRTNPELNNTNGGINLNQSDTIRDSSSHQQLLMCTVPTEYMTISTVANYLDSMITLIIPFCLITFFNMRIAVCVWKLKDQRMDIIALAKTNSRKSGHKPNRAIREKVDNPLGREVCHPKDNNDYVMRGSPNPEPEGLFRLRSILTKPKSIKTRPPDLTVTTIDENKQFPVRDNLITNPGCNCTDLPSSSRIGEEISTKGVNPQRLSSNQCRDNESQPASSEPFNSPRTPAHAGFPDSANTVLNGTEPRRGNRKQGTGLTISTTSHSASESRVTKMLLLVSTVFIVLNLPSHAFRAASFIQSTFWEDDREGQFWLHAAQQISNILLFNTNFAVNFLLYCLSGRNFRKSLWKVVFKKCFKKSSTWRLTGKSQNAKVPKGTRCSSRRNDNESVTFDETLNTCIQGLGDGKRVNMELETGF